MTTITTLIIKEKMNLNKISTLAKIFEKKAQQQAVTQENIDEATPIINEFIAEQGPYLMKALTEAASEQYVSQGDVFDISFKIGDGNRVMFSVSKPNEGLLGTFNKHVGSEITKRLNEAGVDASGYVKNNWLENWGWV